MRASPGNIKSPRFGKLRRLRAESTDNGIVGERTKLLGHLQPSISMPPITSSSSSNINSEAKSMFEPSIEAPALAIWIVPALICALC